MARPIQTFYYSRAKLGLYLLFNLFLFLLAVFFTLTVFPDYRIVYVFAIGSCLLSIFSALFVFIVPQKLATITPLGIKIDRAKPLPWDKVIAVRKVVFEGVVKKEILKIYTTPMPKYKYNFMQKITANSEFGAFSIPLYAMNNKEAQAIETLIRLHIAA
ncbi:MAG: hypothetical protein E7012_06175 [Alphaproteobacteria bacterium]|nr:hypothetical protein [Alphaproteobacteria bacterium]